jgi:hypothetical protein
MGKHGDPDRHDTNPLHGLFRKFEPGHTGFEPDDPEPDRVERDPDQLETFEPITSTSTGETEVIRYGRSPAYPAFESDPEPYPSEPDDVEPPPDVNLVDYEIARNRAPRRWPVFLGLSAGLCAVVLAVWAGRTSAPTETVSDPHSAGKTVFVTLPPSPAPKGKTPKAKPGPTVTKTISMTERPAPKVITSYVPGPRTTVRITPKPKVSIKVSRVPVPGPTKTVECVITITVNRNGVELDRETSGVC